MRLAKRMLLNDIREPFESTLSGNAHAYAQGYAGIVADFSKSPMRLVNSILRIDVCESFEPTSGVNVHPYGVLYSQRDGDFGEIGRLRELTQSDFVNQTLSNLHL